MRSLVFTAQSSVADADVLTEKIFNFMEAFSLKDISDKQVSPPGKKGEEENMHTGITESFEGTCQR